MPIYYIFKPEVFVLYIQAGIETNNLSIALEPEAASVYCKYLPSHQLTQEQMSRSMFQPNAKYMVVDLGGNIPHFIIQS